MTHESQITAVNCTLADSILEMVATALDNEDRLLVAAKDIEKVLIHIPIDIQIYKTNGAKCIINREIKGDLKQDENIEINGKPIMVGDIWIH
jgi:hypothetical protein